MTSKDLVTRGEMIRNLDDQTMSLYFYHHRKETSKGMKKINDWIMEEIDPNMEIGSMMNPYNSK